MKKENEKEGMRSQVNEFNQINKWIKPQSMVCFVHVFCWIVQHNNTVAMLLHNNSYEHNCPLVEVFQVFQAIECVWTT